MQYKNVGHVASVNISGYVVALSIEFSFLVTFTNNCIAFIFVDFQVKNLLSVSADDEVPIKSVTIRKIPR
jgi:hypothetical protein